MGRTRGCLWLTAGLVIAMLAGLVGYLAISRATVRQTAPSIGATDVPVVVAAQAIKVRSALTETGNILACAYLNAMAHLVGRDLMPSPPVLVRDYGASVLQQALMVQAVDGDRVLICRTVFQQEGEPLDWKVLFIPTQVTRQCIAQALRCDP